MTSKYLLKPPKYAQRDLFGCMLKSMYLFAPDSPKKAFYTLSLEFEFNHYVIRKDSGIDSRTLDRREWRYQSLEDAEKSFNRRIHQKTRPDRKSSRKYVEKTDMPHLDTTDKLP